MLEDVYLAQTADGQNAIKMSTKLSLQIGDEIVSWEVPQEDCCVNEIIQGLWQIMLGARFYQESIAKGMKKVLDDEFDIENTQYTK